MQEKWIELNILKSIIILIDSSLMGRATYMGFFVDWFIELMCTFLLNIILFLSMFISIGICLYINGMVNDIKMRLMPLGNDATNDALQQKRTWAIYVQEMNFHIQTIG